MELGGLIEEIDIGGMVSLVSIRFNEDGGPADEDED